MFALLLLSAWLRPCAAQGNELVMATTFSPSATVWIIDRWQQEFGVGDDKDAQPHQRLAGTVA